MGSMAFVLRIISVACIVIGGLMSYGFILHKFGFVLGILAVIFFPVTLSVVPFYEGFTKSNWIPFLFMYGGVTSACIFGFIESKLR